MAEKKEKKPLPPAPLPPLASGATISVKGTVPESATSYISFTDEKAKSIRMLGDAELVEKRKNKR